MPVLQRRRRNRAVIITFTAALAAAALAGGACERAATAFMERAAAQNLRSNFVAENSAGLHVLLCGAGSPLPDPQRGGPCVAVIAGGRVFVFDAGAGASRTLAALRIPQGAVEAVFLTHFHSDHIDGLGELMLQRWVGGNHQNPLPVYGPEGAAEIVEGLNRAYAQDARYRTEHHGAEIAPPSGVGGAARPFAAPAEGQSAALIKDGELEISAFRVAHEPVSPAVGYRINFRGRSAVISGDTVRSPNLEAFAKGADLLVHEALSPELVGMLTKAAEAAGRPRLAKITRDILDYHATPVQAAQSAEAAGARHLLFYHIVPPLRVAPMEGIFLKGVAEAYTGPVTLGRDGTWVRLPEKSDAVEVEELL